MNKIMIRLAIALLLTGCAAVDTCDAGRYQPPERVDISRPVTMMIVDQFPAGIEGCEPNGWACAPNAFGQGRAVVYVKRGHIACTWHELAHVGGWKHD